MAYGDPCEPGYCPDCAGDYESCSCPGRENEMNEPERYDARLRAIVVGEAVINPRVRWVVEQFGPCDCPDCESDGHWLRAENTWHRDRAEALVFMARLHHHKQHDDCVDPDAAELLRRDGH